MIARYEGPPGRRIGLAALRDIVDPRSTMARAYRPAESSRPVRVAAALRAVALIVLASHAGRAVAQPTTAKPALRVSGRSFVDGRGRVVVLRGVNLSGGSKVPPFLPLEDPKALDRLPELGFNAVRLVVTWEALEPRPGSYDFRYLARMRAAVAEIAARGLYVILDVHQDGYSRFLSRGKGDGFPAWSASPRARLHAPDNGARCKAWPILVATDPGMHRSFSDFYSDAHGVRARYLTMLGVLARTFAAEPGVIGYDLLNEPWGHERREIAPLYGDAAGAIRAEDPTAILFLEGHVTTNSGLQTRLPRPEFGNVAYAPHYYKPTTILAGAWLGERVAIDRAFALMEAKADEWGVPLFLGEFGAPAGAARAGDYVAYLYDKLDAGFASGAQWNVTPGWNPRDRDGWNGEDFNLIDPATGRTRPNFRARAFPRAVAGTPCGFLYEEGDARGRGARVDFLWDHDPDRGETEVFLPRDVFRPGTSITIAPAGASWREDAARQVLAVKAARAGLVRLRVVAP